MKKIIFLLLIIAQWHSPANAQNANIELSRSISIGDVEIANPVAGTIRWNGFDLEGFNGSEWVSLIDGNTAPLTDIEGNVYQTVRIGSQIWMAENLRTHHNADGSVIQQITDNSQWDSRTTPAWCWFNNSGSNNIPHGKLYNWYAVDDTELCPIGWRVPSDTDFNTLGAILGGLDMAGGKLKQEGLSTWQSPNTGATNESGFNAVGSGGRVFQGAFSQFFGYSAQFWTTSEHDDDEAWYFRLIYNGVSLSTFAAKKQYGYAVRCIKS